MRFVSPVTVRIDLADGPNGQKRWIEIKKDLTAGEEKALRSAGFRRVSQAPDAAGHRNEVDIDWSAMAFARVETYLVDWSAKKADGKDMPVNRDSIRSLFAEDFDEIDAAINAHIEASAEEKKLMKSSSSSSTVASPSSATADGPGTTT